MRDESVLKLLASNEAAFAELIAYFEGLLAERTEEMRARAVDSLNYDTFRPVALQKMGAVAELEDIIHTLRKYAKKTGANQ